MHGYRVCGNHHFKTGDYLNLSVSKRLLSNAIPTINDNHKEEKVIFYYGKAAVSFFFNNMNLY